MSVSSCETWRFRIWIPKGLSVQCTEIICVPWIEHFEDSSAAKLLVPRWRQVDVPCAWILMTPEAWAAWECYPQSRPSFETEWSVNRTKTTLMSNDTLALPDTFLYLVSLCERDAKDGCRGVMVVSGMQWMEACKFIEPLKGKQLTPVCRMHLILEGIWIMSPKTFQGAGRNVATWWTMANMISTCQSDSVTFFLNTLYFSMHSDQIFDVCVVLSSRRGACVEASKVRQVTSWLKARAMRESLDEVCWSLEILPK